MTESWTPLFSQIVESSVWDESYSVRILWTTMLAIKGRDHIVRANSYRLRKRANMESEQEVIDALRVLSSPDTKSIRSQKYDGRRIQEVEGGWLILNGEYYDTLMREITRKAGKARWQAEDREAKRQLTASAPSTPGS